jgi:hypothetical protein
VHGLRYSIVILSIIFMDPRIESMGYRKDKCDMFAMQDLTRRTFADPAHL